MNYASKMLMVPQDAYSRLISQQQEQLQPVVTQLVNLDEQMKTIMGNPNLPVDVKYSQYDQALRRYRLLKEQQQQPMRVQMAEQLVPEQVPEQVSTINPVNDLPKNSRLRGQLLFNHIKRTPGIAWSENGEVILNGRKVPGSNITDLVHDFVRDRPTVQPAAGWKEFSDALKNSNVPQEAIGNKRRMQDVAGPSDVGSRSDSFSTPNGSPRFGTPNPPVIRRGARNRQQTIPWSPYGAPPRN